MQQHSRKRSAHTPQAVRAALLPAAHQSRALQSLLHPGIAELNAMLLLQFLVKMAHVEIEILLPIQPQDLLRRLQRYPPRTGPATTAIPQSVIPPLLIAAGPTPPLTLAAVDNLRRLPPGDAPRPSAPNHLPSFPRPL